MRDRLSHNTRIATTLLEVLGSAGDPGARARGLRAMGAEGGALRDPERWLSTPSLARMLREVKPDRALARRVGQALVRPEDLGIALSYGGLATPEKAYRRSHHLLPRESARAHYEPREIAGEKGCVAFHPPPLGHPDRLDPELGQTLCAMREGMFEAIPMLYGLVPARVWESECAYQGAAACRFELRFSRSPRLGLALGAACGAACALGLSLWLGPQALGTLQAVGLGLAASVLFAMAGRSFDLARQLEAVAGARRGQLALLDQLDSSLAEKVDALAKLDAPTQARPPAPAGRLEGLVPVTRRPAQEAAPDRGEAGVAARAEATALRAEIATLHTLLAGRAGGDGGGDGGGEPAEQAARRLRSCAEHARRLGEWVIEAERARGGASGARERCRLEALAAGVVARLRPELPRGLRLDLDTAEALPEVMCDGFQIEYVLEQLVMNAAHAAEARSAGAGRVRISLQSSPQGVEVVVCDDGAGIAAQTVDEVFDPFSGGGAAGAGAHLGLPVCFRIVEEHGGELQVQGASAGEAGDGAPGTRVSVVLPPAA